MSIYQIPVSWIMYNVLDIEADSLEEALEKAKVCPLPHGDYVDDSLEIHKGSIRIFDVKDHHGKIIVPRMNVLVLQSVEGLPCPFAAVVYRCETDPIEVIAHPGRLLAVPASSIHIPYQ